MMTAKLDKKVLKCTEFYHPVFTSSNIYYIFQNKTSCDLTHAGLSVDQSAQFADTW